MIDLLTAKTPVAIKDKTGNTVPSETEREFQFELVAGGVRFGTASFFGDEERIEKMRERIEDDFRRGVSLCNSYYVQ